jgi:hypothetical protein
LVYGLSFSSQHPRHINGWWNVAKAKAGAKKGLADIEKAATNLKADMEAGVDKAKADLKADVKKAKAEIKHASADADAEKASKSSKKVPIE